MNLTLRQALIAGAIGAFIIILFGGWSILPVGMGISLAIGLTTHASDTKSPWLENALKALRSAAIISLALVMSYILRNYVISGAAGFSPEPLGDVVIRSVIGTVVALVMAGAFGAFQSLPARQLKFARLGVLALVVLAFPIIDRELGPGWSSQIIFALIFVILGLGLNIVVGFAGLLDLGYAAFFAIGAYTAALLSSPHLENSFDISIRLSFWIVIWIAAVVAGISGLILGAPTLPLRGDYLAIVTLGFGEIVPIVFRNLDKFTVKEPFTCWIIPFFANLFGAPATQCIVFFENANLTSGELGINPIGRPVLPLIGEFQSNNPVPWYYLIVLIILLSMFLIGRLRDSRLGRAWMAIREDELAAAQMGIDPVRTKLLAFAMGAMFSGFAGAFYGAYIRAIFPGVFDFSVSIIVLVTIILGGLGNINGVIVGGLIVMLADRLFLPGLKVLLDGVLNNLILPSLVSNHALQSAVRDNLNPTLWRPLLFGLTLVIMMAIRPEGLFPSAQVRAELHRAEPEKVEGLEVDPEPSQA